VSSGELHGDVAVDVGQFQDGTARRRGGGAQVPVDALDIPHDGPVVVLAGPVGIVGVVVVGGGVGEGPGAVDVVDGLGVADPLGGVRVVGLAVVAIGGLLGVVVDVGAGRRGQGRSTGIGRRKFSEGGLVQS
jgi:hypothetical protein